MRDEIATLYRRMEDSGNWRDCRDEIARLHAEDNAEEEYIELLRCHYLLRLLIDEVYDAETAAKLHPIALSEYKMFLNKEAMEDEYINPVALERITRREIEAGRMDENDSVRELAVSGAAVLGNSSQLGREPRQSAIWGGATIGIFVGLGMKFLMTGATWWTVGKAILIGAAIGVVAELLPRLFALATRRN